MEHILEDTAALKLREISITTSFRGDLNSYLCNYFSQLDTDFRVYVSELEKGIQQIDYTWIYKRGLTIINNLTGPKREGIERDVYDILYNNSRSYRSSDEEYCEWVLDTLDGQLRSLLNKKIKNLKEQNKN